VKQYFAKIKKAEDAGQTLPKCQFLALNFHRSP
jgi:hypothetical protein